MYQPYEYLLPYAKGVNIASGDGTTGKYLPAITGRAMRIDAVFATTDDAIAHVVNLVLDDGSTTAIIGSVSVPAGSGHGGTAAVELVAAAMPAGLPFILLPSGGSLLLKNEVACTAGKTLDFVGLGGSF